MQEDAWEESQPRLEKMYFFKNKDQWLAVMSSALVSCDVSKDYWSWFHKPIYKLKVMGQNSPCSIWPFEQI